MYQPDALILDGRGKCKDSIPGILNGTIPNRLIIVRDSCMIEQEFVHQPALNQWLVDNGITSRRKLNDVQKYHQILQFLFVDLLFPLPSITDRVAAIKKELDWDNHYFIGMHIRSGLLEGNVGWGRFLEPQDVDFFISQAKQYTSGETRLRASREVARAVGQFGIAAKGQGGGEGLLRDDELHPFSLEERERCRNAVLAG